MIALEIVNQGCQERDVAKLDLPNLGEKFEDVVVYLSIVSYVFRLSDMVLAHLCILPVQLPQQPQNLIQGPLDEHIMQEVLNEPLHRRELDHLSRNALWRITLQYQLGEIQSHRSSTKLTW
jgi:hypothetical protein